MPWDRIFFNECLGCVRWYRKCGLVVKVSCTSNPTIEMSDLVFDLRITLEGRASDEGRRPGSLHVLWFRLFLLSVVLFRCRPPHVPAVHAEHDRQREGVPVAVHRVQVLHPLRHQRERRPGVQNITSCLQIHATSLSLPTTPACFWRSPSPHDDKSSDPVTFLYQIDHIPNQI